MAKKKSVKEPGPDLRWVPAGGGYAVALDGDRVVARSASAHRLTSRVGRHRTR